GLLRVIQRRAVLISASVYPSRLCSVVDSSPWAHSLLASTSTRLLCGGRPSEAASSKAHAVLCLETSSTVIDMRSKISAGYYCPQGQFGQNQMDAGLCGLAT